RLRDLVDQLFDQRADAEVLAYARERLAEAEAAEREAWISEQTRAAFCHCSDCIEQIRWIAEQSRAAFCHCSDCIEQIRSRHQKMRFGNASGGSCKPITGEE
ncbi:MAG TPA: hypothetical protein VLH56_08680, partial [Dissulfurispiraceae bacterium]|nr:hypothetical protein [Dissulfurispiraceae bacterium]